MYAVYNYKAGSTAANVSADIIKLLTGETNLANLSADCVTANSSIISTVAAGWTVHDAAAATNFQVIKALCMDGTTWKYYRFGLPSTTALEGTISEGWNASTHTATNGHSQGISGVQSSWNAASGGYFYIYATQKNIVMFSFHSSAYQDFRGAMCLEHTRDTVPTGYPSFFSTYGATSSYNYINVVQNSGLSWSHTRYKNPAGAGDILSTNNGNFGGTGIGPIASFNASNSSNALYRNESDATLAVTYRIGAATTSVGISTVGNRYLGEVPDLLMASTNLGAARDEITISSKTYVLHGASSGYYFLIPKE